MVVRKRNYGIDLMRIVSMFMIVCLHINAQGGAMVLSKAYMGTYYACWFIETACYCAVNCYGLISGYVGVESSFRLSRIIDLWLQVFFYTAGITLIYAVAAPQLLVEDIIGKSLLPVSWKTYWYFSSYTGVFFLSPFLNKLVKSLNNRERKLLIAVLVCVFSIATAVPKVFSKDYLQLVGGYSFAWLMILYLIGACIRKCCDQEPNEETGEEAVTLKIEAERKNSHGKSSHGKNSHGKSSYGKQSHRKESHGTRSYESKSHGLKTQEIKSQGMKSQGMKSQGMKSQGMKSQGMKSQGMYSKGTKSQGMRSLKWIAIYFASVTFAWLFKILMELYTRRIFGEARYGRVFTGYAAPTMLLCSIALLMFFKDLEIRSRIATGMIRFFSPLAFSVYIIHTHPQIWETLLKGAFKSYRTMQPWAVIPAILAAAAAIFLVCALIDAVRALLFRGLRVRKLTGYIGDGIEGWVLRRIK